MIRRPPIIIASSAAANARAAAFSTLTTSHRRATARAGPRAARRDALATSSSTTTTRAVARSSAPRWSSSSSSPTTTETRACFRCHAPGHLARDCPKATSASAPTSWDDDDDAADPLAYLGDIAWSDARRKEAHKASVKEGQRRAREKRARQKVESIAGEVFRPRERLKTQADFTRVQNTGRSFNGKLVRIKWCDTTDVPDVDNTRLGIKAPKKLLRRAVDRNSVKRRVRDIFRKNKEAWPSTCDMLVFCGEDALRAPYADVKAEMLYWGTNYAPKVAAQSAANRARKEAKVAAQSASSRGESRGAVRARKGGRGGRGPGRGGRGGRGRGKPEPEDDDDDDDDDE